MSCFKHVLGIQFARHAWKRRVTLTEDRTDRGTDMWSRAVPAEHVICHIQYVCSACGAVRDGEECTCDKEHADRCAPRLAYLAALRARDADARASA